MAPYYDQMLAGFEQWDPEFDVNVGNLPYCILPKWGSRIHHGGQETVTKSADAVGLEDAMNKYEWHGSLRTYLPGCDDCVFRPRCTGIFRVYLQLHGEEEFRPVTRDALLALDPERRNFVVLVEPELGSLRAALAAGETPAGWRNEREVSEDRRRRVEMAFAHQNGTRARFVFLGPGRGRAPLITCDAYDVDVESDPGVPADAFAELLAWVHERLMAASDRCSSPVLLPGALERNAEGPLLLRGRERVTSLARRVKRNFALSDWGVEPLRWPTEMTAELPVRGPGGASIDVCFAIGARGKRSTVGVGFRSADPRGDGGVSAVIDALVALLREAPGPTEPAQVAGARA
jgi:hypothetical protein